MPGNDIEYKIYLYGKIVVGAVMLVQQAVGTAVSVDKLTMERTVTRTAEAIRRSSAFQKAIQEFTNACLCFSMSKWDWVKTSLTLSAMLIATFASEGLALIGKIALLVLGAVDLAEDIEEAIRLG